MSRLRIGVVGLNFGKWVIEQITTGPGRPWLELAAVCDVDATKARALASQHGVTAYTDLDALLADRSIPAIGLFTGPVGRADLVRKIVCAGKNVLTTKPFELDPAAARDVLCEAKRLERVVHLNSPGPVVPPDLALIRQWRDKHRLGQPVGARADVWVSYRENADGSWYDDAQRCPAAPIFRLGIYLINDLVALFGEPQRVALLQSRLFTGRPTADNAQLGILFSNGALANIYASFCIGDGDQYRNSLVLNFENGTIYRNCGPHRSAAGCELSLVMFDGTSRQRVEHVELPTGSGDYQWENFYRAVHGEPLTDEVAPEQIVAGVRVIQMMKEAQ